MGLEADKCMTQVHGSYTQTSVTTQVPPHRGQDVATGARIQTPLVSLRPWRNQTCNCTLVHVLILASTGVFRLPSQARATSTSAVSITLPSALRRAPHRLRLARWRGRHRAPSSCPEVAHRLVRQLDILQGVLLVLFCVQTQLPQSILLSRPRAAAASAAPIVATAGLMAWLVLPLRTTTCGSSIAGFGGSPVRVCTPLNHLCRLW